MKYTAIITAGGTSSRFGGTTNKLLEKIHGKEILKYTVEAFLQANIDEVIISTNPAIIDVVAGMFQSFSNIKVVEGGATRQESVRKGLEATDCDYVLIHDGARPMIAPEIIKELMVDVVEKRAISVMTKTVDTIKEVDEYGLIIKTIDRSKLYNTQTPQAFEYKIIKSAHETLKDESYTDDAGMLEYLGYDVFIQEGDYRNIKVTTKSDLALASIYLGEMYGNE